MDSETISQMVTALQQLGVAGTIVGCVGLIITKVVSAVEDRLRTLDLIEKALEEYKTNHPEEREKKR